MYIYLYFLVSGSGIAGIDTGVFGLFLHDFYFYFSFFIFYFGTGIHVIGGSLLFFLLELGVYVMHGWDFPLSPSFSPSRPRGSATATAKGNDCAPSSTTTTTAASKGPPPR